MKQRLHQRRRVLRIPSQAKHDEMHVLPPETQRVEAAPHVHVELVALHFRAGVHDRVDAVVLVGFEVGLNDRSDRKHLCVGCGNAAANSHTRGGRVSLAICRGFELETRARNRPQRALQAAPPGASRSANPRRSLRTAARRPPPASCWEICAARNIASSCGSPRNVRTLTAALPCCRCGSRASRDLPSGARCA